MQSDLTHTFEVYLFPEGLHSTEDAKKDLKERLGKMLNAYNLQIGFRTAATTVLAATKFSSGIGSNNNNNNGQINSNNNANPLLRHRQMYRAVPQRLIFLAKERALHFLARILRRPQQLL